MKDRWIFYVLGGITGVLATLCLTMRPTVEEPLTVRVNHWHEVLIDEDTPTYQPTPTSPPVPIPDTIRFVDLPIEPFRKERMLPIAVNDSNWVIPISVYGLKQGGLTKLEIEAQQVNFTYEVKYKKQIDWKWTAIAFGAGMLVMYSANRLLD